ncbi:MFS transporter [Oceanimonas doudoroffii]|uniref:MFS transporter n=1 Tax=Oceanimonas doudoroffii TaxID=84158 RepID=A0A233RG68_9GAMM|nr:MFS transporter [Oceanimonas doudoroffii]OXY82382.1 MFS transporter [Oceanimonas doudoroffii]
MSTSAADVTADHVSRYVWIKKGTAEYKQAGLALFLAGFASFSLIYCVQPLLPDFALGFNISPAQSSLALSLTTVCLALAILLASAFSQAVGRRGLMFVSMLLAAVLNVAAAAAPDWHFLLVARALEGFVLGGVPAVAMAYLAEEIEPPQLAKAMGLYIAGTAFGAMMGRVGMGLLTGLMSWNMALAIWGGLCMLAAVGFIVLLPPSRNFVRQPGINVGFHVNAWRRHVQNLAMLRVYAIGFVITSIFVTIFNYATFRLTAAPYQLNQTEISLIFLLFGCGVVVSSVYGSLAKRFGGGSLLIASFIISLLGIGLTLFGALIAVLAGMALVTIGFFTGHSAASSAVGPLAKHAKGHASSLYLLFYYLGASVTGTLGGWFWQQGGWQAVTLLTVMLLLPGLALAWCSRKSP